MRERPLRLLVVSLAGVVLLVAAFAASPVAAIVALSPAVGPPTTKVVADGSGFGAQEVIDLAFDGVIIAHATSDPEGSFSATVRIPRSAHPGEGTVGATGETSGSTASATFLVRTDWPQFHFDASRSGENPYENVLSTSNVSGLEVKWAFQAKDAISGAPVVVGGVVYFGDGAGNLYAVDVASGLRLWSRDVGNCGGSPAVVAGIVYTATCVSGGLIALDAQSGDVLWSQFLGGGVFGSPAVVNGLVYEGSNDTYQYALDAGDGHLEWRAPLETGAGGPPSTVSNGLVYIGGYNSDLYAFDAQTGAQVWTTPVRSYTGGAAVANGVVYVGTNSFPPFHVYAMDAGSGMTLWSRTVGGSDLAGGVHGTPTLAGGLLYVAVQDGNVYAFKATTGKLRWTFQMGDSPFLASPAVANGVLYIGSSDGIFHALDARTGAELWSYSAGVSINVAAAVADGVVYVGSSDRNLYAFALPG
jgi:outer membrane protein assembly factor BamB